jgi:Phage portal protein, SPP1 Gp6-like
VSVMSLADAQVTDASAPSQDIPQLAAQILVMREKEQWRLQRIGNYMRGHHDSVYVPRGARDEYKWLIDRSKVNYLPLIVSVVAQNLHVDGYRASAAAPVADDFTVAQALQKAQDALDQADIAGARGHLQRAAAAGAPKPDNGPWEIWQANRMGSRQHGLHRCIMKYGLAYTVVLPGKPFPVIRPVSPRRLTALYADEVDDEWPVYAVEEATLQTPRGKRRVVTLYDDRNRYILTGKAGSPELGWPDANDPLLDGKTAIEFHGLGVCPVVRFLHEVDLDGDMDVCGEVEPLIEIQDQINTTTFNGLMAQQYGAHRQRWATGMVNLVDEDGNPQEPFRAGVDRLWATEGVNTKFGEFGQTDLSGYLNSREASIRHMSTISQVPPYHLLGQIANLSAEALAAARDGLDRKVEELQGVLSEPHKQNLQLASQAAGDTANASDPHAVIAWRDTGGKAFAATVDALGKLSQMLGVPATELWAKVPGVTTDEVEQWKATATQGDALSMLDQMLERQGSAGAMPAAAAGPAGQQPGDQNPTPEEPWQTDVHRPLGV